MVETKANFAGTALALECLKLKSSDCGINLNSSSKYLYTLSGITKLQMYFAFVGSTSYQFFL